MNWITQLKLALWRAPLTLRLLKSHSSKWLAIYLIAGLIIFALVNWQLLSHQHLIKQVLLDYLFPQSWQSVSEDLLEVLFANQAKIVIGNGLLGASLMIASLLLFPIKEAFSAAFEKDAQLSKQPSKEFPLWLQAWEEIKLFLFYLTAQSLILWIGYYPFYWTKILSIGLSYFFLFFTFGVDFITPTLQRHRNRYSLIIKVLTKNTGLVIAFGFLFSAPLLILSHFLFAQESLTLIEIASGLFIVNMLCLTLAVPAGTYLAAQLMPQVNIALPVKKKNKIIAYGLMFTILLTTLFLHSRLIASLHHKSQLLKANYSIDWSSIDFKLPSLDSLLGGPADSNFSVDLVISNPTEFDIHIETSQLTVEKLESTIATIDIQGFSVPAGEKHKIKLQLDSLTDFSQLKDLSRLLADWRIDLEFELWPGIPFKVNLFQAED